MELIEDLQVEEAVLESVQGKTDESRRRDLQALVHDQIVELQKIAGQ